MSLSCLIIDDEPLARKLLIDFCGRLSEIDLLGDFSNGLEALKFLNDQPVDFIFLDIKMPGISGIDMLNSLSNPPKVIFTTAFAEYAVDGFELDAVDYLLKPFDFPRFLKAINKVKHALAPVAPSITPEAARDFIFIKDGRELVKVYLHNILYIKGQKDYVMFQTKERKIMSLMTMRELENELKQKQFIRIHQSYIINAHHISSIANDKVKIGHDFLPISQSYKMTFRNFIDSMQ